MLGNIQMPTPRKATKTATESGFYEGSKIWEKYGSFKYYIHKK